MKKNQKRIIWIIAIINLMILSSTPLAFADSATPSTAGATTRMGNKTALPLETEFVFTGGYRRDDMDWNIAGDINGNNPNILSELTWDDIESYQVKFQGSLVWPKIIALKGSVNYGWIFNFDYQDWSTDDGTIKFFLADGTTHKQQLNEVNWTSYALSLGLSLRF